MSNAWETTAEDVLTVLTRHNIKVSQKRLEEIHGDLDHDSIEEGAMCFQTMDAQADSMLDDIENQLMENGIISKGGKKFFTTEDDNFDEDEDDDDFDEEDDKDY